MIKTGNHLYKAGAVICLLLLQSCLKKELPVPKHETGGLLTGNIRLNKNYTQQVYYNLRTNKAVDSNLKRNWSLGFEATATGYHVILNSSMLMYAYNTGKKEFSSVSIGDTTGHKAWDNPAGGMDSTGIADWRADKNVYIIDCGTDNNDGAVLGFKKVQFLACDEAKYSVRFADMNGNNDHTLTISKDSAYNFTFLDMQKATVVSVEPPKASWDIVFTQYTHIYTDLGNLGYRVTGCLLNRYNTTAIMDSTVAFWGIALTDMPKYTLTPAINSIGFEWKVYSTVYVLQPQMIYMIKSSENLYFKLHFIDFKSADGTIGFEYQQL